jgi:hypothetical protein
MGQQRLTFFERELRHVAAVEPHDVKDVIRSFATAPCDLAIQNQFLIRKLLDGALHSGKVLRQVIA